VTVADSARLLETPHRDLSAETRAAVKHAPRGCDSRRIAWQFSSSSTRVAVDDDVGRCSESVGSSTQNGVGVCVCVCCGCCNRHTVLALALCLPLLIPCQGFEQCGQSAVVITQHNSVTISEPLAKSNHKAQECDQTQGREATTMQAQGGRATCWPTTNLLS
jgi:hypothetical protein